VYNINTLAENMTTIKITYCDSFENLNIQAVYFISNIIFVKIMFDIKRLYIEYNLKFIFQKNILKNKNSPSGLFLLRTCG
jgi:hypothetical protein